MGKKEQLIHTMDSFLSNAKINLGLQILYKREDGYHNIHSLFLEIDLADKLVFSQSSKFSLTAEGTESSKLLLDKSNLITKAYRLIKKHRNSVLTEYAIHIKKNIPMGSGLGGGSSNAAVTLVALSKLWGLNLDNNKMEELATSLGADVPFFIRGGVQLAEGIGDILSPLDTAPFKDLFIILVIPKIHISTSWAYGALNKSLYRNINHLNFAPLLEPINWELFDNDFERVIHETYPEIGNIKANLQETGALYAGLSGSGSAVFGVFDNLQKAETILENFSQYQTFLTSPVSH